MIAAESEHFVAEAAADFVYRNRQSISHDLMVTLVARPTIRRLKNIFALTIKIGFQSDF